MAIGPVELFCTADYFLFFPLCVIEGLVIFYCSEYFIAVTSGSNLQDLFHARAWKCFFRKVVAACIGMAFHSASLEEKANGDVW